MLDYKKIAYKVSFISIIINAFLFVFKFLTGVLAYSSAMISDAVHSFSDVMSTIIVMIGVKLSYKEADLEHPYGHEKIECIAAVILAIILFITGLSIGYTGVINIISKKYEVIPIPGLLALIASIVSILIKETMYWYTRYYAKKIDSQVLMADAWHHRSDSFSSIGSFIGVFASRMGLPIFDSLATIVICVFILKVAFDIFRDSIDRLIDRSCSPQMVKEIEKTILENKKVLAVDSVKTRLFGNKVYADVEIKLDGRKSLLEVHKIAEEVHDYVEYCFPNIKHCMIKINPSYKKDKYILKK